MIAVFPQAAKTWQADSDDAKAALAALDDVLATYKVDRDRVDPDRPVDGRRRRLAIAAAHPERFAAVVPVCGRGEPRTPRVLKALPVWAFVGDADRDRDRPRTPARWSQPSAPPAARPGETEYRGVGHNSWDRAYNDPDLIDWMLGAVATADRRKPGGRSGP